MLATSGVESVKLPPRSPDLNAHAERLVRGIKESCLERLIFFGEGARRKAIHEYVAHHYAEGNHQSSGNRIISPKEGHLNATRPVQKQERLGGMLNYYYRTAA
jgi:putative transposase